MNTEKEVKWEKRAVLLIAACAFIFLSWHLVAAVLAFVAKVVMLGFGLCFLCLVCWVTAGCPVGGGNVEPDPDDFW